MSLAARHHSNLPKPRAVSSHSARTGTGNLTRTSTAPAIPSPLNPRHVPSHTCASLPSGQLNQRLSGITPIVPPTATPQNTKTTSSTSSSSSSVSIAKSIPMTTSYSTSNNAHTHIESGRENEIERYSKYHPGDLLWRSPPRKQNSISALWSPDLSTMSTSDMTLSSPPVVAIGKTRQSPRGPSSSSRGRKHWSHASPASFEVKQNEVGKSVVEWEGETYELSAEMNIHYIWDLSPDYTKDSWQDWQAPKYSEVSCSLCHW
jgi:hypothetical protein